MSTKVLEWLSSKGINEGPAYERIAKQFVRLCLDSDLDKHFSIQTNMYCIYQNALFELEDTMAGDLILRNLDLNQQVSANPFDIIMWSDNIDMLERYLGGNHD